MNDETLKQLFDKLDTIQNDINVLKSTVKLMENRQEMIYNHLSMLEGYKKGSMDLLEDIRGRVEYNTHKLMEHDIKLFTQNRNK